MYNILTQNVEIIDLISLIIAIIALIISIYSLRMTKEIAIVDRKISTYTDAIVYLDKISFIRQSPEMGFGDGMINVNNEWIKEQVLVAVDIYSRLKLLDKEKSNDFWEVVTKIYGKEHVFDQNKYQKLRKDIIKELN